MLDLSDDLTAWGDAMARDKKEVGREGLTGGWIEVQNQRGGVWDEGMV